MKIAIDANEANVESRVRTGQYAGEILSRWHSSSRNHFDLLLKDSPLPNMPQAKSSWHYRVIRPARAWTRLSLPLHLLMHRDYQVFWNPAHYLPPYTGCPSVVTIHDLAYEYFPSLFLPRDLYKLKRWTRRAVKQADRVIAVSEATKQDLIKLYDTPADKITVVYNGYNTELFNMDNTVDKSILKPYSLFTTPYVLFSVLSSLAKTSSS